MVSIYVSWGNGKPLEYQFNSQVEVDAFIAGIEESRRVSDVSYYNSLDEWETELKDQGKSEEEFWEEEFWEEEFWEEE